MVLSTGNHAIDFALRIAAALILGALIGLEREWRQRTGGTRTNALVAAAAAAFVMAGKDLSLDAQARIAAQVVSGVGFLGAGAIFKEGLNIHGLNSAATIWCAAAMGTLCGMGQYYLAGITGCLVLITNVLLRPLIFRLHPHRMPLTEQSSTYTLTVVCAADGEEMVRKALRDSFSDTKLRLTGLSATDSSELGKVNVTAMLRGIGAQDQLLEDRVAHLRRERQVIGMGWTVKYEPLD